MDFEWDNHQRRGVRTAAGAATNRWPRPCADLIDASIRTGVDAETIRRGPVGYRGGDRGPGEHRAPTVPARCAMPTPAGRWLWTNPAVGRRNPVAPPMTVHHEADGGCWSEFTLGPVYEGPPGLVHGGICALVLDHILGEVASEGMSKPRFTGTITLKYLRGTPLGPLRAEAFVDRIEGHKTYARGFTSRRTRNDRRGRRGVHHAGMGAGRLRGCHRMKFYVSSAFLNTGEIVEIARAADDLGYEGIGIPDHVVNLETLATPYPYTEDGQRRWQPFTDWPDPWVLVGALAQATERLKFVTTVYIPGMRDPYSAAKSYRHGGLSGRRPGGTRHRGRLVRRGIHADGPAVRKARQAHRRDAGTDAGALAAGLDGSSTASSTRRRAWR